MERSRTIEEMGYLVFSGYFRGVLCNVSLLKHLKSLVKNLPLDSQKDVTFVRSLRHHRFLQVCPSVALGLQDSARSKRSKFIFGN